MVVGAGSLFPLGPLLLPSFLLVFVSSLLAAEEPPSEEALSNVNQKLLNLSLGGWRSISPRDSWIAFSEINLLSLLSI